MKKILGIVFALAILFGAFAPVPSVYADSNEFNQKACEEITDEALKEAAGCNTTKSAPEIGKIVIETAISVVGIVAVIMIVVGGQRFVVANGDPGRIAAAKNMVLYAVIGLVISLLAFAIVNFVSISIQNNANTGSTGAIITE